MAQTALITGCSSGFGTLIALELAGRGHRVVATMRHASDRPEAEALRRTAAEKNLDIRLAELDVTDEGSVSRTVAEVAESDWGLDVVVNNAGRMAVGFQEAFTVEDARTIFETYMRLAERPHARDVLGTGLADAFTAHGLAVTTHLPASQFTSRRCNTFSLR